jgi:hypothetical protein
LSTADRNRTTIPYANGDCIAAHSSVFPGRAREVRPGSELFVPSKPEGQFGPNRDQIVTRSLGAVTGLATSLLAIQELR